jgi:hypothetical protein
LSGMVDRAKVDRDGPAAVDTLPSHPITSLDRDGAVASERAGLDRGLRTRAHRARVCLAKSDAALRTQARGVGCGVESDDLEQRPMPRSKS